MSRVLIVDDESSFRVPLAALLARVGHDVSVAETAREAIAVAARVRPDVMIVDWMLKDDVNGIDVSNVVHAQQPDVRVILVSGFPSPFLKAALGTAGIRLFVEKPCDFQDLADAVARVGAADP
jgi:DNA-binding NtrC family response regulator